MKKKTLLFCFLSIGIFSIAQEKNKPKKQSPKTTDSTLIASLDELKQDQAANIATISLDDNDLGEGGTQNVSSVLTAGRDPFMSAAAFNFFALRFRARGYESDLTGTFINGVSMDNLDNGFTPFGLWGGLNDVLRNRDLSIGLRPNTYAFGDIGNITAIDVRASKQRKQTEIGYAFSNRNYTHKFDITHSTGISKKGWAFSFSASRRYADEAYFPGTSYDGWSWFAAVDKRIGQNHLLSLAVFGAPTKSGRQGTGVKEAFDLVGNDYNPNWGWQNGKKRNAAITRTNQPVAILTHDYRINNSTNLVTAASFSVGERGSSNLDWYHADNPNPQYYRYLPSYWEDADLKAQLTKEWQTNDNVRQINWNKLYDANYGQTETFNGVTGKRSRYVQFEYLTKTTRLNLNTVLNARIGDHTEFTGGASFQYQKNNNYKKIIDLLGGDYYVDLNQFAERINANNQSLPQSNLNNPNRIVKVGDDYGYNYDITINRALAWAQVVMKYNKLDYFASLEFSGTGFARNGNYKNGLFPNNSFGKAEWQIFKNYAFKTGFTYKLNGRNYFYGNIATLTKAPFFDNVYLSPRVRNTTQDKITNEDIRSVEAGYTLNAPKLKVRLTGYYTEFHNQMNVLTFFHDTYLNLVNYGITGINKTHSGGELGIEAKVLPNLTMNAAAAVGRYYYTSTQNSVTTIDNDASVVSRDVVYAKGYYVGGTPQQAYSVGFNYRSPKFWSVGITYNYFDDIYVEINPLRRTAAAVQGLKEGSPEWRAILDQTKLQSQSTVDMYASYSLKLPKSWSINKKNTFLAFSLSASNLLNNRTIIPFAFEQLRFDASEFEKFPGRYNYAYGVNYAASVSLRF
ncbi:MAG: TonB-dependent receptor domain-containing protein [Chitinophagaceae bacterium]